MDLLVGFRWGATSLLLLSVVGCSGASSSKGTSPGSAPVSPIQGAAPAANSTPAAKDSAPKPGPAEPPPKTPTPPPTPDTWIDDAVAEALDAEVMPGTSGEADPAREPALRAFFAAHPEYRDPEKRQPLWDHACGLDGTEAAHAWLTQPPPKTPVVVKVESDDWRVFAAHADVHCTSDDWAWYSAEANQAATARGAAIGYGDANNDVLVVQRNGEEVARFRLTGQGYVALRSGRGPIELPYDPVGVEEALDAYFGPAAE